MKKFDIEIEETLQKVVSVDANSVDEAIDIVHEMYRNEEIILDENDFKDVEFREYKDEIFKFKNEEVRWVIMYQKK